MKCPIDKSVLKAELAEAHTGYGCESCKGSWLPKKYIDSLQYTKDFKPQQFWLELTNESFKKTDNQCPFKCGALHAINNHHGMSYCPSCLGIWFEAKALKNMLKNYRNKSDLLASTDIVSGAVGVFDLFGKLLK